MVFTVKDVCQLDILQQASVKTASSNLEHRTVEWVSVIETPVEDFVRKDEFVLTTGIGCAHDPTLFFKFVKEIIDSNASALVIATGRYIFQTPQSVIDLASEHQFPIIEIPWEIRFADVIQAITSSLQKNENNLIARSEQIRKQLLNMILQGSGLTSISNFIYSQIKLPIMITDKRGFIKGYSPKSNQDLNKLVQVDNNHIFFESNLEPKQTSGYSNIQFVTIADKTALQLPIQSTSEVQGYLFVLLSGTKDQTDLFDHDLLHLLEHAVTTIALCFLQETAIRETEMRLRDDFVWSLAKGKITSWDTVLSRAKSLGYNVNLPYICIIGLPENSKEVFHKMKVSHSTFEHWNQKMIRNLEDEIYYAEKKFGLKTMTTYQKDEIIIYLETKVNSSKDYIISFLDHIETELAKQYKGVTISWGISKQSGVKLFYESFNEAHLALNIGRRQKGTGNRCTYADTRLDRALMTLLSSQELKNITDSTIGSLIQYTNERGIDLIHTFVTYNRNRGNVSQTSRELNLHRQSLLYRLRKIESLTGCSIDNQDDNFLIELAIKLWTLGIMENPNTFIEK